MGWEETRMDEYEDRIDEVKSFLAEDYRETLGQHADEVRGDTDVWVEGWLSEIYAWALDFRSEIEELG